MIDAALAVLASIAAISFGALCSLAVYVLWMFTSRPRARKNVIDLSEWRRGR